MIIEKNVDLTRYNTIRLHATAEVMYTPQNTEELIELIKELDRFFLLSGGSNVLINDARPIQTPIINMDEVDSSIQLVDNGVIRVGCSVKLQMLIQWLQERDLGGIEYLYSVPGFVGGATVMNAGRGKKFNQAISDFILRVECIQNGKLYEKSKDECEFGYRNSVFLSENIPVTATFFSFNVVPSSQIETIKNERIQHTKKYQDMKYPNAGSIFRKGRPFIFRLIKGRKYRGAAFSKITPNWINNLGDARFRDITKLIRDVKLLNKLTLFNAETEIIELWE